MATFTADDMQAALQAIQSAAQSAADAASTMKSLQDQRGAFTAGDNFKEASRMVRQPDPFGSEDHESDLSK